MSEAIRPEGPDLSRRDFLKTLGVAVLTSSVAPGPIPSTPSTETAVTRFYRSLKGDQKTRLCFPHDHPLRSVARPNWAIVKPTIGDLTAESKALCTEVFQTLCSDDGLERFLRQMDEDHGGFENYHVALFGEPDSDQPFEWVLTGRHVTLRAGGVSSGGPIFYGHARRAGNVWWYQAERANALFKTLDETQKAQALDFRGDRGSSGLTVRSLDGQQKGMVRDFLKGLLLPFRSFESETFPRDPGGVDSLRLTCCQQGGTFGPRDVWRLEGPAFSWYFHGTPHVHAWLNISGRARNLVSGG